MKKAIVIGASSGIGRALARVLADHGYSVGLVARRAELLAEVAGQLPTPSFVKTIDVAGNRAAPAYNASKAFISNYLEALRNRFRKANLPIVVTDVQPGFVDTAMAKGEGVFWAAPPEKAAGQIFAAIANRKEHAYVTKRWRVIA